MGWAFLSVVLHHQLCRRFEPHPGRPPGKSAEPEQGDCSMNWPGLRTLRPCENILVAVTKAFPSNFFWEEDNFYCLFVFAPVFNIHPVNFMKILASPDHAQDFIFPQGSLPLNPL